MKRLLAHGGWLLLSLLAAEVGAARFDEQVSPLLVRYCCDCHGADKQKGEVRMDGLDPDLVNGKDTKTWHVALHQLNQGSMPPAKSEQPSPAERKILVDWMTTGLAEAARARRFAAGRVSMRRLTRYEYQNTMCDLLGVELDFARELPPEPASSEGLLNNRAVLEMTVTQIEMYLAVARAGLAVAIVEGERPMVIHTVQTNTSRGRVPDEPIAGLPAPHPEYALDLKEYPRSGPFRLRVTGKAAIPEGAGFPRIQVALGYVPGILHVPRKKIGEIELSSAQSRTFEFFARMEDFPQPGPEPDGDTGFDGMVMLLDFLDADGRELRYPDREYVQLPSKSKKGQEQEPEPRPLPSVFGSRLEILVESVEFEGPYHPEWPPDHHRQLLGNRAEGVTDAEHARARLAVFMQRAFRRPVSAAEIEVYGGMFDRVRETSASFEAAMREVFAAVLVSPHFLYVVETRNPELPELQPLTGHELATRLSYFLWSTMPDGRLSKLADAAALTAGNGLVKESVRMLDDPRSHEFAWHFADQWLDLGALDRVAVNPEFYPDFDNTLKADMRREAAGFFERILREDRSALELLDADWAFVNRALARHYGLKPLPRTQQFEPVALQPEDRRGGVLGQAAFLLGRSGGERGSPVKRAVWILDRLLDTPPAPPPPNVPAINAESPSLAGLTMKEQLALHRERETCANCHRGIDPWGIPLEHYDAVGIWRENAPVRLGRKPDDAASPMPNDAQAELPDGIAINGAADLKRFLKEERRESFASAVVRRLMGYALGRSLDFADRETVDRLARQFAADGFRLRKLILALVQSEEFRTK